MERFVGSTSESSTLASLLRNIALQICKAYSADEAALQLEKLPSDPQTIGVVLDGLLASVPTSTAPLYLFIDNLGHLAGSGAACVRWIPIKVLM